jgi:hypothetical protein
MLAGSDNLPRSCLHIYNPHIPRSMSIPTPTCSLHFLNSAAKMSSESHVDALDKLDTILTDFGLSRKEHGTSINFVGEIPAVSATSSQKIDLSLIGTIPALANAVAATQIYEARGGASQTIEVDLRRGHNYIDPDIGMTPSINGQVRRLVTFTLIALSWKCFVMSLREHVIEAYRFLGDNSRLGRRKSIPAQHF